MTLSTAAQTGAAQCTANGQPVDCDKLGEAAAGIVTGIGIVVLGVLLFCIVLLSFYFAFWLLSLIHLVRHPDTGDRILWIILVLLVPFACFVYYFGPRRTYDRQHQLTTSQPLHS